MKQSLCQWHYSNLYWWWKWPIHLGVSGITGFWLLVSPLKNCMEDEICLCHYLRDLGLGFSSIKAWIHFTFTSLFAFKQLNPKLLRRTGLQPVCPGCLVSTSMGQREKPDFIHWNLTTINRSGSGWGMNPSRNSSKGNLVGSGGKGTPVLF